MENKSEKLSLLADLVAVIRADHKIDDKEMVFLETIARQFGFDARVLDSILTQEVPFVPPKKESERILQFHRMVLLMNIDNEHHSEEIKTIKELGLRLGLSPFAIERVLKIMNRFEDRIVPPDVMIDIFKTYYN